MWCLLNISAHRSTNRDNECNMYAFYNYQPKENEISLSLETIQETIYICSDNYSVKKKYNYHLFLCSDCALFSSQSMKLMMMQQLCLKVGLNIQGTFSLRLNIEKM